MTLRFGILVFPNVQQLDLTGPYEVFASAEGAEVELIWKDRKRATTHWYAHDFLAHFGAIPVDGRIVQDGNLITAGGVTSGIDFGLAVVAELLGQAEAETVQLILEYAPAPPFQSGTPAEASAEVLARAKQRLAASRKVREAMFARWREQNADIRRFA